jgi:hypothetical protein
LICAFSSEASLSLLVNFSVAFFICKPKDKGKSQTSPYLLACKPDAMKRKSLLLVFFSLLLISSNAFCQSEEDDLEIEKLRIHLAPLNAFDPVSGVLQLGIQKNLGQRIALSVDHGFKMRLITGMAGGDERKDYKYSKSKVELKYYLDVKNKPFWEKTFTYLSVEGMYFPQTYSKENDWIHRDDKSFIFESSAVQRRVLVGSLKFGKEVRYSKVVIDKYIGIGMRQLTIKHQTIGEVEQLYDEEWGSLDHKEGVFNRIHISLGVKIGLPLYR